MNVRAPMNGAVNNHVLAQTIHEKMPIFCLALFGISSAVHVTKITCEHVVAILDSIANVISSATVHGSGTENLV